MKKILIEDLTKEEPEIIEIECVHCGDNTSSVSDYENSDSVKCNSCGSTDFYEYTNIESVLCDSCKMMFDIWDEYYVDSDDHFICITCYDDAERLDEDAILIKE